MQDGRWELRDYPSSVVKSTFGSGYAAAPGCELSGQEKQGADDFMNRIFRRC